MEFEAFFQQATTHQPQPWQRQLAQNRSPGHRLIRIPTGFGKTLGVACAWLYHSVLRADRAWPRRLLWTLPMRTLVEQTEAECRELLRRLDLLWDPAASAQERAGRVGVHVLLGGGDIDAFHLHPGAPAILIGTQDMLLSRALNRGYGAARARWPMDFGLLSQDALWVLDEIQLMGVGFATALQLAAFRQDAPALRPCFTWAMSATLQPSWVRCSPDTGALAAAMTFQGLGAEDRERCLWRSTDKPIARLDQAPAASLGATLAERVLREHAALQGDRRWTLVVCNTVDRARALYDELLRRAPRSATPEVDIGLVHSRFRGADRRTWQARLRDPEPGAGASRILVATQVIEAGVDLSADLLFTELCPWPSLVQRLGRLARRGGRGAAFVQDLEDRLAAPYDPDELGAARDALALLSDASPRALEAFEEAHPELMEALYPFTPPHLLLREEIDELFDTTTDLSGGDLDVSRFIREGDERDLSVAWTPIERDERGRPRPPAAELRPGRDALCAVPFLLARDWLCGKKSGGSEPRHLRKGVSAFVWDYLLGAWRLAERADLRPGALVLVDAAVGGYDPVRGFDPKVSEPVPPVPLLPATAQDRADAAQDQEDLSFAAYQTIAFHGAAVAREAAAIAGEIDLADERMRRLLDLAARWHDLGKAHPAFQGAIRAAERPRRQDLAKAPAGAWPRGGSLYGIADPPERRPGLRHELASVLGLFDVLSRWAPPSHPARLGAWAQAFDGAPPRGVEGAAGPSAVEEEILALPAEDFDLVAYLVCAHHGKLRARLHAAPVDQEQGLRGGSLPIRGVYEGDQLPAVELAAADGGRSPLPQSMLTLEPASLGLSPRTGRSWTERVDALRAVLGPFALAYLEALLRVADVRASMDRALSDPVLEPSPSPAPEGAS